MEKLWILNISNIKYKIKHLLSILCLFVLSCDIDDGSMGGGNDNATGLSAIVMSSPQGINLDFSYYEGNITDACDLPSNNLYLMNGDVLYNSSDAIGGFQFNVDGVTVNGASGGDAAIAGFTVSVGSSIAIVLGFSFTGSSIPSGCGTLTQLSIGGR